MISLDLPPASGKLCEAFWTESSKPPAKPEVLIETVKKPGNLPPSERKIVTKETHQGCLSFAITGFSELKKF
jgi:hypothetical protein